MAPELADAGPETTAWLAAFAAAARGDYETAERFARPLAGRAEDPGVRVASCLTLASILRQTGRHAEAIPFDEAALEAATTDADRADAFIGLAADAVGLGQADRCAAHLDDARALDGDLRTLVRLAWVRTEHALLTEDPAEAVRHARAALTGARTYGSARHVAKSMLFLGAALEALGDPESQSWLSDAESVARGAGALAVAEVARVMQEGASE